MWIVPGVYLEEERTYGIGLFSCGNRSTICFFLKKFRGGSIGKIRISDTGIGIKKEDLENIFDPFFTTKAPDKGTGLGLSISLRIVESLGGEMRVESELEKGTTFEIYFPVV
jgi:signal transduction histidine kinase